jgi:DNA-binding PadR family transcriptional regulator
MPRSWKTDPLSEMNTAGRLGRGEVKLLLLAALDDGPRHGYELMKAVEELSGGRYVPSAGVVYPSLKALAQQGLLRVEEQDERRSYALTPAGKKHLSSKKEAVATAMRRFKPADGARADLRALGQEAQRMLLELFDHGDSLTPTQVSKLRKTLAEAATKIKKVLEA